MSADCDICHQSMRRHSTGRCASCRRYEAEHAAMTPKQRRADEEAIAAYVAESEKL